MAKHIVVERDGRVSTFAFTKVDRAKLYGKRQRIALDPEGEPCIRASLTGDGSLLLRAGMTAQGYFDDEGAWIPVGELKGIDADGNEVPPASTLDEPQPLDGPVPPQDLLDLDVDSVYALDPEDLDQELAEALARGEIYRFPFSYRSDHHSAIAYLVGTEEALFALVGQPARIEWCVAEAMLPPSFEDEEEDELDFELF